MVERINSVNLIANIVKSSKRNMVRYTFSLRTKAKYIIGLLCLLLLTIIYAPSALTTNSHFDLAKQEVLLRKVGHELLLQSKDSTSRVMPIKKISDHEYQIRFEKELTFQPDTLVQIIKRTLETGGLSNNYIVNVLNCAGPDVLFGYAIFKNEQNNIVPCTKREQPRGCYVINLKFQPTSITSLPRGYLIGGLSIFAFMGILIGSTFKIRKKRKIDIPDPVNNQIQLGNTFFDVEKRQITHAGICTDLTPKENQILQILAHTPNAIIERNRLQKEIWEDEGVIVGRSLDVFISKLRKKLERDESIQLVNVHGKGYRLKVDAPAEV